MDFLVSPEELSPAQRQFASLERAAAGMRGTTGVFMYREERHATYRWLVSQEGYVLDSARFARASVDLNAGRTGFSQIAA